MPTGENLVGSFLFGELRERVRNGAEGRAGVREAVRGGGFLPGGRRRGGWGRDSEHIAI